MANIEVEIRSFVSEERYNTLLTFFKENAKFVKDDYQETFYFDGNEDLRIQRNNSFSKIWLKRGKIHDDCREEIEIKFERVDFEKLEKLFLTLGFNVRVKWFRERHQFDWDGIKVCVDYTKGYGHIIELEKLCTDEEKENALILLRQRFEELNIPLTPREEFERKFRFYEENWRRLVEE